MPNSVKYNTESEANALRVGNMHIGTGDVPKGPTSTTGFYGGINPPNGGYTIYENKAASGSSMTCPTSDAELISVTNQIAGASYTTINECFTYFAGQNDKMVLANPINPIVTDGLVLNLSANILPSYPRSGTSWKDLSGESNNGVLTNSPTFDSNGWFDFDGVDDRVNISNSSNINISDNFTFSILVKSSTWTSGNQEGLVQKGGISNYGAYLRGGGGTVSFYTTPTFYWAPGPNIGGDGKWHYLTFIYSYSQLGYKQVYHNGSYHAQIAVTVPINSNNSDINIGYAGVGSPQYLNAEVANYKLYNKVLSPTEILQNYYQAPIITDGLVLALDAGNLVSYENGDTTTHSLTGSVDGTLNNGVGFSSGNGGTWEFDGIDDYIDLGNQSLITDDFCIDLWYKLTANKEHYIFTTGYSSAGSILIFSDGIWLNSSSSDGRMPGAPGRTINEITNITVERTNGVAKWYKNGIYQYSLSYSGAISTNTNYSIGWAVPRNKSSAYMAGDFYSVKMYNRGFTADEVSQNYRANINRFN